MTLAGLPQSMADLPRDLLVGILGIVSGGAIIAWSYGAATLGGMIAAGSGLLMVLVGGACVHNTLRTPDGRQPSA